MKNRYLKCSRCPAFYLLTEPRKIQIENWEYRRDKYIDRINKVKLILLGESMPAGRYFYDLSSDYDIGGLRFTLKQEFNKSELPDGLFLESLVRKGIILFDCALCPLHKMSNNTLRREAATYCFLTINIEHMLSYPKITYVTIFPSHLGFKRNEIPVEILIREKCRYSFSDQAGLYELYNNLIARDK
ncbi:MAG: hypothetical protein KA096_00010 [Bacteroidales bacterium]|nr:hypothetical protein [Bacteroidales bacterium]